MSSLDTQARLRHMLEAADKAARLARGRERADLDRDETLALALTRLIEVMGEAANGIPEDFQMANPQIPWKQVIGTRHRIVHGYFNVDNDILWQIVTVDLDPLIAQLRKLKPEVPG